MKVVTDQGNHLGLGIVLRHERHEDGVQLLGVGLRVFAGE